MLASSGRSNLSATTRALDEMSLIALGYHGRPDRREEELTRRITQFPSHCASYIPY